MKLSYSTILTGLGMAAMLASCSENSWNDDYLDGFETPGIGTGTTTVEYTLTDADYKTIATNSANIALAEADGEAEALAAVETDKAFATEQMARKYIPALISQPTFPYFALNNGSSVKMTYRVSTPQSETMASLADIETVTVTEQGYQQAWGSEEDYIAAYAPMCPAARNIPAFLQTINLGAGYVLVGYNEADTNPIFGTVSGGDEPEPEWEPTDVLGTAVKDAVLDVRGYVTGVCARGFILTDNTGSILCYQASGFDTSTVSVGMQIEISGTVTAFGTALQFAIEGPDDYSIVGMGEYTYPAPKSVTVADIEAGCARTGDYAPEYVTLTAEVKISGNYVNFLVGSETCQGSSYMTTPEMKAQLTDGETTTVTGYFVSVSSGKFYNVLLTSVGDGAAKAPRRAPVVDVPATPKYAVYTLGESGWRPAAADIVAIQPADYTAMGCTYGNFSGSQPAQYIPAFLASRYPYAAEGDVKYVVYKYYASGANTVKAAEYKRGADATWSQCNTVTEQFSRTDGEWRYNPSVTITLPYSRNTDPSYSYFMQTLQWVFDNVSKPLGATETTSAAFIDYRGNAEFYSGTSAFYGNVDTRAVTAKGGAPEGYTGYDGLTDEQITALVRKRFCTETMPYAMAQMNPAAMPVEGMEVEYVVNFTEYTGSAVEQTIVFTVTGPGQFKYKSCTWYTDGEDKDF